MTSLLRRRHKNSATVTYLLTQDVLKLNVSHSQKQLGKDFKPRKLDPRLGKGVKNIKKSSLRPH